MHPYVASHDHSLDDIVGYRVILTVTVDGTRVWQDVAEFDDPSCYAMALTEARAYRLMEGSSSWARVVPVYSCGCSEDHEMPATVTA